MSNTLFDRQILDSLADICIVPKEQYDSHNINISKKHTLTVVVSLTRTFLMHKGSSELK
jgi:hypothetical protein